MSDKSIRPLLEGPLRLGNLKRFSDKGVTIESPDRESSCIHTGDQAGGVCLVLDYSWDKFRPTPRVNVKRFSDLLREIAAKPTEKVWTDGQSVKPAIVLK